MIAQGAMAFNSLCSPQALPYSVPQILVTLEALTPQKRGRKVRGLAPLAQRVVDLERENARLSHQLKQAETDHHGAKKVSEILGIALEANASGVGP